MKKSNPSKTAIFLQKMSKSQGRGTRYGKRKNRGLFYAFSIFKNAKTGNTYLWYACFLRLQMLFKAGITKAEPEAMAVVVNNNIFNTSGGDIVEAVEGRLRTITLDPVVWG